jgi:hypothetical protein
MTNRVTTQSTLAELFALKRSLTRKKNNPNSMKALAEVADKIDALIFIPELINVQFDDKRHFAKIVNRGGIDVNGIRYVPFMASAGQIRRSSILLIDSRLKDEITKKFNNGRDLDKSLVPAKFSAYYSLYSSSTLPVSFPRLAVVPDLILKSVKQVEFSKFIDEHTEPKIDSQNMELEFNAFDGSGLVSPDFAQQIADELEIDYLPSTFIVRAPFLKGMVVTFDFHEFASQVAKTSQLVDIYGKQIDINSIDMIVTESMLKLWDSYSSTASYMAICAENNLGFGISKVAPEHDRSYCKSSYQFLQVLDLSEEQIEDLCAPTLNWLASVGGGKIENILLYLLGDTNFSGDWFRNLDATTKALLYENSLMNDSYTVSYLNKSIQKKKNDAKMGRLMFNGNYSIMIPDPYLHACHIFKIDLKPLLNDGEHYSKFWNDRNVSRVAGIRSPIVHSSEVNVLNFKINYDVKYWYQFITSGVIFPANGIGMDCAINGGSDFDGDLIATINSPEILAGRVAGLPVMYATEKPPKHKLGYSEEHLVVDSQAKQIGTNKIGFYTNVSSTLYALLANFKNDSPERSTILNRLKYGRVLQGLEIDRAKGLLIPPFPERWVKWNKIKSDTPAELHESIRFNNSIIADKRPYFMRWLYPHYNKRYLSEIAWYNTISATKWKIKFLDLLEMETLTKEQSDLVARYKRWSHFITNDSTMCRVSKYIEAKLKKTGALQRASRDFNFEVLTSKDFKRPSKMEVEKIALLFKEFKSLKKSLREGTLEGTGFESFTTNDQIASHIHTKGLKTISSNASHLTDIAVYFCYKVSGANSKSFAWQVFGNDIVDNIRRRKGDKFVRVPMRSDKGDITYLWEKYGMYILNVENE